MSEIRALTDYLLSEGESCGSFFKSEFPLNQYAALKYMLPENYKPRMNDIYLRVIPFSDGWTRYPEVEVFLVQHLRDFVEENPVQERAFSGLEDEMMEQMNG